MKTFVIVLVAFVTCSAAVPASIHPDLYKNRRVHLASRIVEGQSAVRRQFPHQLSVQWGYLGRFVHICGATLIRAEWAVTAAHCDAFSNGIYQVVGGMLNQGEQNEDIQIRQVVDFILHSNYTSGVAPNDIALLKLETAMELTDAVQLALLPGEFDCYDLFRDVMLSGWGLTSPEPIPPVVLQFVQLPRISNRQCCDELTANLGYCAPLDNTMICTDPNPGTKQTACSGDSGGPLVLPSNTGPVTIVGAVSWGVTPCGERPAPSVFTSICAHLNFIYSYI